MKFNEIKEYRERLREAQTTEELHELLEEVKREPARVRYDNYDIPIRSSTETYETLLQVAERDDLTIDEARSKIEGIRGDILVEDATDKFKALRSLARDIEREIFSLEFEKAEQEDTVFDLIGR